MTDMRICKADNSLPCRSRPEISRADRLSVGAILAALLFPVPAFVLHTSPRFAGNLAGFALGAAAAALMLSLLIYPLAKYSLSFRLGITGLASMRALLAFHVYAGVFGAFLAILHRGHKPRWLS